MKASVLKWLTASFAVILASSFVSMMGSFLGSAGSDLRDLLLLQLAAIPLALVAVLWCATELFREFGTAESLRMFWRQLPGWLLFAVIMALSLVMIAELSFVVLQYYTSDPRPWLEHIPAVTALASSLALACCYVAYRRESGIPGSGRAIERQES